MSFIHIWLPDLCTTRRFGRLLASNLMAGDVIALSGALGTGKSALARSIIQAVDPSEVDVPSLLQLYNITIYQTKPLYCIWICTVLIVLKMPCH